VRLKPPGRLNELSTGLKAEGPPRSRLGGREGAPPPPAESKIEEFIYKILYKEKKNPLKRETNLKN